VSRIPYPVSRIPYPAFRFPLSAFRFPLSIPDPRSPRQFSSPLMGEPLECACLPISSGAPLTLAQRLNGDWPMAHAIGKPSVIRKISGGPQLGLRLPVAGRFRLSTDSFQYFLHRVLFHSGMWIGAEADTPCHTPAPYTGFGLEIYSSTLSGGPR
ncbi:hypothetical protein, partial [Burkholderia stagnalis]